MSLFRTKEWWKVDCGHDEEFDVGALCLANIDNSSDAASKVITGSLQGVLRIYHPAQAGFRVEDLLLEQHLGQPILQIETGTFTHVRGQVALAILHPREVVVCLVAAVAGEHGATSYLALQRLFSHKLDHTAANLVVGPFGGVPGSDSFCVQSMDGQLSFVEHEVCAFTRFLPNFLLPGPLCYIQKTDAFVTCNAAFEVECYKYQVLAAASAEKRGAEKEPSSGLSQAKRLQADWSLNIGEPALAIQVARFSRALAPGQLDLVVLGERTLFCLTEGGALRSHRRLDYHPSALAVFPFANEQAMLASGAGACHNLLLGTSTGSLMVYRGDGKLIWAARGDAAPVALNIGTFGGIPGQVALLSEAGQLCVCYMGTEPPLNVVGASVEGKELDYEAMDAEQQLLKAQIREATSRGREEPADRVVLRAQVPTRLDNTERGGFSSGRPSRRVLGCVTVRLFVSYMGADTLQNVHLSVAVPRGLTCNQPILTLASLSGGRSTPCVVPLVFSASTEQLPCSLSACVVATYSTRSDQPRSASCTIELPLALAAHLVLPTKTADYKITLESNRPPPALSALFDELVADSPLAEDPGQRAAAANVLTFQFHSGQDTTILVSKNAGRYRLQSGCFEGLGLLAEELHLRLTAYFAGHPHTTPGVPNGSPEQEPFRMSFEEALPLQDFFALVDNHFNARLLLTNVTKRLAEHAAQLRAIQKRLLVRFRDKNPGPLQQMDALLTATQHQLLEAAASVEHAQRARREAANALAAGTAFILLLIRLKYQLDDASFDVLKGYISPIASDGPCEQGWEECTLAATAYLLRTVLSRSGKEAASVVPQPPLAPLLDTARLKKQIALVCEKLGKGAQLVTPVEEAKAGLGNTTSKFVEYT